MSKDEKGTDPDQIGAVSSGFAMPFCPKILAFPCIRQKSSMGCEVTENHI